MAIKRRTKLKTLGLFVLWLSIVSIRIRLILPIDHLTAWVITIVAGFICTLAIGWYLRRLYEEYIGADDDLRRAVEALRRANGGQA